HCPPSEKRLATVASGANFYKLAVASEVCRGNGLLLLAG
ncbi:MAG: hypothetical protein ACI8Y6_000579, partial [Brevundimonas sp.]